MNNLKDILRAGRILMYGYKDDNLPFDLNSEDERLCIYSQTPKELAGKLYEKFIKDINK